MVYQEIIPDASLHPYIEMYLSIRERNKSQNKHFQKTQSILNRGLVFYNMPDRASGFSFALGLSDRIVLPHDNNANIWNNSFSADCFVVLFKPEIFKWLFPFSMLEFINKPALKALKDRPLFEYCQMLQAALSIEDQVAVSNKFLTDRTRLMAGKKDLVQRALKMIYTELGLNLKTIAENLGVSDRHFRRVFASEMGVQPKHFQQMVRIAASIRKMNQLSVGNISSIAYECGFFDQSHFDSTFKDYTGMTPSQYLNKKPSIISQTETNEKDINSKNESGHVRFFLSFLNDVF